MLSLQGVTVACKSSVVELFLHNDPAGHKPQVRI